MVRVACHVKRPAGEGAIVALVWHKKHIEERTGRGILPEIKSRMMNVGYSRITTEQRKPVNQKVLALFPIGTRADLNVLTSQAARSGDRYR
jgi:hypothetical protein